MISILNIWRAATISVILMVVDAKVNLVCSYSNSKDQLKLACYHRNVACPRLIAAVKLSYRLGHCWYQPGDPLIMISGGFRQLGMC